MARFSRVDAPLSSEMTALLQEWARKYTPSDDLSEAIVRKTLGLIAGENSNLKMYLFQVLHQVAREHLTAPTAGGSSGKRD